MHSHDTKRVSRARPIGISYLVDILQPSAATHGTARVIGGHQMATPTRDPKHETDAQEQAEVEEPSRPGDVLGLSDAPPEVEIPRATTDRGGNPAGIEVRTPASGIGDLRPGKGATGIQMGAGGSGVDLEPDEPRPSHRQD
jgi:hypothetical protein